MQYFVECTTNTDTLLNILNINCVVHMSDGIQLPIPCPSHTLSPVKHPHKIVIMKSRQFNTKVFVFSLLNSGERCVRGQVTHVLDREIR